MKKQQPSHTQKVLVILTVVICLLTGSSIWAAGQIDFEPIEHYSYTLKHISTEQGKMFLNKTGIGTASPIPDSSILFITAPRDEMIKAKNILNLMDRQEGYVVHLLKRDSLEADLPTKEQIAARLNNISLGDFTNPPSEWADAKAMLDTFNDTAVIIAPLNVLDKILQAIQNSTKTTDDAIKPQESVKSTDFPTTVGTNTISRPQIFEANMDREISSQRITQSSLVEEMQQGTDQQALQQLFASTQSAIEPIIPNADDVLTLNLPEKFTIVQFLGWVGPYLQLSFTYNATQLAREFTFNPYGKFQGQVTIGDLYSYLEDVLRYNGLVMTRGRGDLVFIVPEEEALKIDPALVNPDNPQLQAGDVVITSFFELKYIDTSTAEKLLTDQRLSINLTSIPETQTLIVTAYAYRMQRIREWLDIIDKPTNKRIRFRQLRFTEVATLVPKIQSLAEKLGTVSLTIATTTSAEEPITIPPQQPNESVVEYQRRVQTLQAQRRLQLQAQAAAAAAAGTTSQQQTAMGPTVHLDADERTNRILMIGRQDKLDQVEQLIDTLDVAQQDLRTYQTYKIEHISAEEIRNKLNELSIISDSQVTGTSLRRTSEPGARPATSQAVPTTVTTSTGETIETIAGEPQVVLIEATNSLLVRATAEQHDRITAIIGHLDNPVEQIPYQMYQLKNQDPNHVEGVLQRLVQETILDPEGKIESTVSRLDEQVKIIADATTSSLIVFANKKNQDLIGDLIGKLDKRRPQVLIDVTLVEITKNDAFTYDLNLLSSFPDLTSTSGLTRALLPGVDTGASNLVSPLLNSRQDRFVDFQSFGGSGTGFYGDRHINALLTAMQQKNYGRVLANPQVLVNDNEMGKIERKDVAWIPIRSSAIIGSTGTAGQNVTPVETSLDYRDYPAGILLEITPHISENDLRMDIYLRRADFLDIPGDRPPDTSESNIDTIVTIPDGSTIVLGGMVTVDQKKGDSKVPFLGDIPLIGGLFRSASNSDSQRNLYIFVKAQIIRAPDVDSSEVTDLQLISDKKRVSFELQEDDFQKHQGWPGITPEKMEPFKVLNKQ